MLLCSVDVTADEELLELLDFSLEELTQLQITTVSRVSEDRDHSAGNVHVITQEMIKARGYRNLRDVLQVIPGFTVFLNELMYSAGIRGLNSNDNEKITLLINGRETNGVNEPDFLDGTINLDSVERVEIIVGPSSLFQQANTLAATVNVITKKIDGAEGVVAYGTDDAFSATAMVGKQWQDNRYANFSITADKKDGFNAWDRVNWEGLAGRNVTGKLEPSFFAHAELKWDDWWGQLTIYDSHNAVDRQINSLGLNNDGSLKDKVYQFDLEHTYEWSPNLTSKTSIGAAYKRQSRLNQGGFPPDGGLEQNIQQTDYKAEFGVEYKGIENHFIQTGLQLAYEDNGDSYYTFENERKTLIDQNTRAIGLYFSDTWQYNEQLKLIAGVRADENSIIDDDIHWGGRLAAVYDMSDTWISKVMINRAVRMPSPLAALNQDWGINNPNPPVFGQLSTTAQKPETLTTYEWQNILYFSNTRISATLYYQELKDFIAWQSPHTNMGDYDGYGLELDINHSINDDLSIWATASYIETEFEPFIDTDTSNPELGSEHIQANNEGEIISAPEFTANVGIDYRVDEHWNLNSQVRYFTGQTAFSLAKDKFEKIDHRVYVDAAISYEDFMVEGLDLRLSGQNIFNNRKHVATQWSKKQYQPRGASYFLTLYMDF
jgi:outer membrane receptor protein involved in Fe transport